MKLQTMDIILAVAVILVIAGTTHNWLHDHTLGWSNIAALVAVLVATVSYLTRRNGNAAR